MSLQWSTGLRDFVQIHGSYKRALQGGTMRIMTGAPPSDADAADTGSLLCTISLNGGAVTKEVQSYGTVTLSGAGGQVNSIQVNGVDILGAVVAYITDLATTAAAVAAQINSYQPVAGPKYIATSSGAVITITALPGTGTTPNTYTVVTSVSGGTLAKSDVAFANGVAGVNGLTYGADITGVLSKSADTWAGTVILAGTAGYFRLVGSENDDGTLSTVRRRVQGTCGISGADYNMTSVVLAIGDPITIKTFNLKLPGA
jgi:hypothetical protein